MKTSVRRVARQKAGPGERVKKKLGSEGLGDKVAAESSRKARWGGSIVARESE
jgi:hypothetical protein